MEINGMKKRKKSVLLLLIIYSLVLMEILGIWVEYTGQVSPTGGYQPGVTYACLYLRDLSAGAVEPPFTFRPGTTNPVDDTEQITAGWESEEQEETEKAETETEDTVPGTEETTETIPLDPLEQVSVFQPVSEDYFNDALFIGDSRIAGLSQYGNLEQADFAAEVGLTIFHLFDKKFLEVDNSRKKETIEDLLEQKQYKKIYLMVGINELGTGDEERFQKAYREALEKIETLQPNAIIFVQGLMHVTEKKSKQEKFINNEHINIRNMGLAQLADGKRVFYLDINPLYDDENGCLNPVFTGDGVHLKAQYYGAWREYLMTYGIIKEDNTNEKPEES